ncbi:hypothetical protein J18TS1_04560 [Oceanobacillus oncorhynchi subsp. incaldanensis]|uniref:Glyoxalase/fosfomycin resistance/dioxygenase domain-containing protein n=1 Tax=Oceanobacillus oncorhynchi TaxID=545501 RepID=A0A0A1MDZ8_9BACI|nr:VOC family protein [Oceanobacillus oncorhynchi]GIO17356.1 hypothetical protein J18TS1_04560 [Oceanobacillus oncorhynchi subsp. incaldanensis]CEI83600.1 hypothetical protein BN997_03517 [Oceanobacillus oncorhynchi]
MTDFRIEKLNTIVVPVKDLDRSIAFYKDILYLEQGFTDQSMAFISAGTSEHELYYCISLMSQNR